MVEIIKVSKSFGSVRALDQVSLSLEPGILCGLVGPNGAGKTTLFKILIGLLEADSGRIIIDGEEIKFGDTDFKRKIGYAPETPILYEYLTGHELMHFIAAAKQVADKQRDHEIRKWLDFFELTSKGNELIKNYSHGMRRKISLTTALLGEPSILFLDEATNGLDPESSFKFKAYLKAYCQKGSIVLFSSHIIETVEHLCDRMIILHQGKVKRELYRNEWEGLRGKDSSLEELFIRLVRNESE